MVYQTPGRVMRLSVNEPSAPVTASSGSLEWIAVSPTLMPGVATARTLTFARAALPKSARFPVT